MAGDRVVVAPNADLPGPVVATGWVYKRKYRRGRRPEALRGLHRGAHRRGFRSDGPLGHRRGWVDTAGRVARRHPPTTIDPAPGGHGRPDARSPRVGGADPRHSRAASSGGVTCDWKAATTLGDLDQLPPRLPLGLPNLSPLDRGPLLAFMVDLFSPPPARRPAPRGASRCRCPPLRRRRAGGSATSATFARMAGWVAARVARRAGPSARCTHPPPSTRSPPSPYSPSSRRWHNPLLIDLTPARGARRRRGPKPRGPHAPRGTGASTAGSACGALKRTALEDLWLASRGASIGPRETCADIPRPSTVRRSQGWATLLHAPPRCTAAGGGRGPPTCATRRARGRRGRPTPGRGAFHAWLQLLLDGQLLGGRGGLRILQDLAVGAHPGGRTPGSSRTCSPSTCVGAPPDDFAPAARMGPAAVRAVATAGRGLPPVHRASGGPRSRTPVACGSTTSWDSPACSGCRPEPGRPRRLRALPGGELLESGARELAGRGLRRGRRPRHGRGRQRAELTRAGSCRLAWSGSRTPARDLAGPGPRPDEVARPARRSSGSGPGPTRPSSSRSVRPTPADAAAQVHGRLDTLVSTGATTAPADVVVEVPRRLGPQPGHAGARPTLEASRGSPHRPERAREPRSRAAPTGRCPCPCPLVAFWPTAPAWRWSRWPRGAERRAVPGAGFEPASPFEQRSLSAPCMPFHHPGVGR